MLGRAPMHLYHLLGRQRRRKFLTFYHYLHATPIFNFLFLELLACELHPSSLGHQLQAQACLQLCYRCYVNCRDIPFLLTASTSKIVH